MKKIIYSGLVAIAGLFASSCIQNEEPLVVYNPEDVVAPTITAPEGAVLSADGENISFSFTAVEYGFSCPKTYQLMISPTEDFATAEKLGATYAGDKVSVKQAALNSALLNIGAVVDEEFTVYLKLKAWMANNKNTAILSTETESGVVSAAFTPYNQLILDKDVYEYVYVIGDYCGWSHDKTQYLYNYSKDGSTFEGVIDFDGKAANGFKLTGGPDWDHGNWGSLDQSEEAEAGSVSLVDDGGSKDIKAYSKRFYHFSFDKSTLTLKKDWGADQIGVVGDFNGWGNDVVMEYNAVYNRFYADIEVSADGGIKCRADSEWALNWGADGNSLNVAAGNYRVYLNLNKGTLEVNASMYGKEEPGLSETPEEPVKPTAWSLIGTLGGTSWDTDFDLVNVSGDIWVIKDVAITADDEFKIRADHDWGTAWGGPEENDDSTIDPVGNPYKVFRPTLGTAFAKGGVNIHVGVAGNYDITLDFAAETILVEEHSAPCWALIGQINGDSWSKDVKMTESESGIWVSPVVSIAGEFKIRYNQSWADADCYGAAEGVTPEVGKAFSAAQPGANIKVPEGSYTVTLNLNEKTITVNAATE